MGFKSGKGNLPEDLTISGDTPKITIGDAGEEDTMLVFKSQKYFATLPP